MKSKKNIQRVIAVWMTLMLLICGTPAVFAKDVVHIRSAVDLITFSKSCVLDTWSQNKTVELEANISLEGSDFTPIPSFSGVFHGNGYTISGLNLNSTMSHAGLFYTIEKGGAVYRLNVSGTVIATGSEAAGGIAAVNSGTIFDCSFSGTVSGKENVGGIVGRNALQGSIWNSRSAGAVYGDSMTGGIAGQNAGLISGCNNAAYVNTTVKDTALSAEDISFDISFDRTKLSMADPLSSAMDSGGIAGYSSGVIRSSVNTVAVGYPHVGYNVGGIAGRSCGFVFGCENRGAVYGRKDVGGIAGQMEPYIEMTLSENMLETLQRQLAELNELIDKAADDAEGGTAGVSSRLNSMVGYAQNAASEAENMKVVIDAGGSLTGEGQGEHETDITVTPGGNINIDVDVSEGSVSVGISHGEGDEGSAEIDGSGSASGTIDGSAQVIATPDLGGLTSAINGIGSQLSQLNGAVSGMTGQLAEDVREINAKFNELSNTLFDAVFTVQNGEIISDTSIVDVQQITLGKIAESQNTAPVNGDLNVGGIAGCMAIEYTLDPEDDASSAISSEYRKEYELKAVILGCTNTGEVEAKRSYLGGICGRMDLGLITESSGLADVTSESGSYVGGIAGLAGGTIRGSFAKGTLSGKKYVGGIVGSGITETMTGAASTVTGCYSMVKILENPQYAGAVSGARAGNFLENYFVSDTLAGIDGQSYGGQAEAIRYKELLSVEKLPEKMQKMHLSFMADDVVLYEEDFDYGASFGQEVYPEIPQKEGYYAVWDKTELKNLHFDTQVTAVYYPYTTAISAEKETKEEKPVFLVEGDFDSDAVLGAEAMIIQTEDFAPLSAGFSKAIGNYLGSTDWYRLLVTPIHRNVEEQWHLVLPEDGAAVHKVHYTYDNGKLNSLRIYIRQGEEWEQAECETFGSYLVFEVPGTQADVAVVSVLPVWWAWLILAVIGLGLTVLLVLLVRKAVHAVQNRIRQKKGAQPKQEVTADPKPDSKKRRWVWVIPAVVLAILALAAILFFILERQLAPYQALHRLQTQEELSVKIAIDTELDGNTSHTESVLQRKTIDGQKITYAQIEGIPFYYADGAVILESGKAYQILQGFPDYTELLQRLAPLYQNVEVEHNGDVWEVEAEGETAQKLVTAVLPELSGRMAQTQSLTAQVELKGRTIQGIRLIMAGALQDGTPFSVEISMKNFSNSASFTVPDAVAESAAAQRDDLPVITEDTLTLLTAWQRYSQKENTAAEVTLSVNCGPVVASPSFTYYTQQSGEKRIHSISKDGIAIYWSDDQMLRQDGTAVSKAEEKWKDYAQVIDIAYRICQSGELEKTESADAEQYTIHLDSDTMKEIAALLAPDSAKLDLDFTEGTLTMDLTEGNLSEIHLDCQGRVKVAVLEATAGLSADIVFTDAVLKLSKAVENSFQ